MAELNWTVGQGGGIVEKDEEDQQSSTEEAQEQADLTAVYEDDPRTDPANWDGDTTDVTASWSDAGISGIDNGGSSTGTSSTDEVRNPESALGGSTSTSDLDPSGAGNDGDDTSSTTTTTSNKSWGDILETSDGSKSGGGTTTTTTTSDDDPKGNNKGTDTAEDTVVGKDDPPIHPSQRDPTPMPQLPMRDPTRDPEPMQSTNENGRLLPPGRPALGGRDFRAPGGPPPEMGPSDKSGGESNSGSGGLGGITKSPVMVIGGMGLVAALGYFALGALGVL